MAANKKKESKHSKLIGLDEITPIDEHNEIAISKEGQGVAPVLLDDNNHTTKETFISVDYKNDDLIDKDAPYFCHTADNRAMTDDVLIQNLALTRTFLLKEIIESLGIDLRDTDPIKYNKYEGEEQDIKRYDEWLKEKNYQNHTNKIDNYSKEAESFNRVLYLTHYEEITTTTLSAAEKKAKEEKARKEKEAKERAAKSAKNSGAGGANNRTANTTTTKSENKTNPDEDTNNETQTQNASTTTIRPSSYVPPALNEMDSEIPNTEILGGGSVKEEHWSNEQIVEGYVNHMSQGLDGVFKITDKMYNDIMSCPRDQHSDDNIFFVAMYEDNENAYRDMLKVAANVFRGMWGSCEESKKLSPAVLLFWAACVGGEAGWGSSSFKAEDPLNTPFDAGIMVEEAMGNGNNKAYTIGVANCGEALYGLTNWESKYKRLTEMDPDIWNGKTADDYIADNQASDNYPQPADPRVMSTWISRQKLGWHCKLSIVHLLAGGNVFQDKEANEFKKLSQEEVAELEDDEYERMIGACYLSKMGNYAAANHLYAGAGTNAYDDSIASARFSAKSNKMHFQKQAHGWHNQFIVGVVTAWLLGKWIFENNEQELPEFPWNI